MRTHSFTRRRVPPVVRFWRITARIACTALAALIAFGLVSALLYG